MSSGVCVYRKGLEDEKKLISILKLKKKGSTFTVNDSETNDPSFIELYTLISANVKLDTVQDSVARPSALD